MNKNFILIDKTNNMQKGAYSIVKFTVEEKDYLIYSINENEQNKQIFVSRLTLNTEGKYFIDNINPEEKNKLSNIVYNIVILTPSNAKKGGVPADLIKDLTEKFNIKLSVELPELSEQEYYNNCSIAITGKEFVDEAIKFYEENIITEQKTPVEENNSIPTWEIPSFNTDAEIKTVAEPIEVVAPIEMQPIPDIVPETNPAPVAQETVSVQPEVPEEPISVVAKEPTPVVPAAEVAVPAEPTQEQNEPNKESVTPVESNPQTVKLSDPSLGINNNNMQPNVAKKNAGFTINKYIIIGTACIVIAIVVVVVAYLLIQKKINGA